LGFKADALFFRVVLRMVVVERFTFGTGRHVLLLDRDAGQAKHPLMKQNDAATFACSASFLFCVLHVQPVVFQAPNKIVILSEALRRYRRQRTLWRGVEGPRRCLLAGALRSSSHNCTGSPRMVRAGLDKTCLSSFQGNETEFVTERSPFPLFR
jgi:hypothetical protein